MALTSRWIFQEEFQRSELLSIVMYSKCALPKCRLSDEDKQEVHYSTYLQVFYTFKLKYCVRGRVAVRQDIKLSVTTEREASW